MALLHPHEIAETGITAEYWRLTHLQADLSAGVVEAQLHGYRDEAARRAGKAPLSRMNYRFPAQAVLAGGMLEIGAIYRAVRAAAGDEAAPDFAAANDA